MPQWFHSSYGIAALKKSSHACAFCFFITYELDIALVPSFQRNQWWRESLWTFFLPKILERDCIFFNYSLYSFKNVYIYHFFPSPMMWFPHTLLKHEKYQSWNKKEEIIKEWIVFSLVGNWFLIWLYVTWKNLFNQRKISPFHFIEYSFTFSRIYNYLCFKLSNKKVHHLTFNLGNEVGYIVGWWFVAVAVMSSSERMCRILLKDMEKRLHHHFWLTL